MFQTMSIIIVAGLVGLGVRGWFGGTLWGLLAVNVVGSFVAGYLGGLKDQTSPWVIAGVIGFCGCLTTFSGFSLALVRLFEAGEFFKLATNFFLHNALCLLLCYVGFQFAHKL